MEEMKRLRKFLMEVDDMILNNEYWDDEKECAVCTCTEEDIYNGIMKTEEFHLLGTERVKGIIHMFMTDYSVRMMLLKQFKVL